MAEVFSCSLRQNDLTKTKTGFALRLHVVSTHKWLRERLVALQSAGPFLIFMLLFLSEARLNSERHTNARLTAIVISKQGLFWDTL